MSSVVGSVVALSAVTGAVSAWRFAPAAGAGEARSVAAGVGTTGRAPTPVLSPRRVADLVVGVNGRASLERTVAALTGPERLGADGSAASCVVVRGQGRTMVARQPELPVLPASTLKVLTATAVLGTFGANHTFSTTVRAASAPVGGVVTGDLWLVGGGDPLLATQDYLLRFKRQPQIATGFEQLADRIAAAGITRITGGVVGDDRLFDDKRAVDGWKRSYITSGEVGPLSALAVNDGFFQADPAIGWKAAPQPAAAAAQVLVGLLQARGVQVDGAARAASATESAAGVVAPSQVASLASPPLSQIVSEMLTESDNTTAETLLKDMGVQVSGVGSTEAGVAAMRGVLEKAGLPLGGSVFHDGSGLDRGDRATCALLAAAIEQAPAELLAGLPVGGTSGTLQNRMRTDGVRGKVLAKTGTLNGVSALAGTVTTRDQSPLHFAMVLNSLASGVSGVQVGDDLAAALVSFPDGPTAEEIAP